MGLRNISPFDVNPPRASTVQPLYAADWEKKNHFTSQFIGPRMGEPYIEYWFHVIQGDRSSVHDLNYQAEAHRLFWGFMVCRTENVNPHGSIYRVRLHVK